MRVHLSHRRRPASTAVPAAGGPLDRIRRRGLARQDRLSARLAELHAVEDLLTEAAALVSAGWVQHGWFAVLDGQGRRRTISAYDLDAFATGPVIGACLVGGVVHAAGGPPAVRSQLVQRTLDLVWHTLHEDEREPVRWCPGPAVRAAHLRDLTRWNDSSRRTAAEVAALLSAAVRVTDAQIARTRALAGGAAHGPV